MGGTEKITRSDEKLSELIKQQQEEPLISFPRGRRFFDNFERSPVCQEVSNQVREAVIKREFDFHELVSKTAGEVFQQVGFQFFFWEQPAGSILLSPEKTFDFWKHIHPKKKVRIFPIGTPAIENVYVPDGIVIDQEEKSIKSVVEYTLQTRRASGQYFENKKRDFEGLKYRKPEIFSTKGVELYFCLPLLPEDEYHYFRSYIVDTLKANYQAIHVFARKIVEFGREKIVIPTTREFEKSQRSIN